MTRRGRGGHGQVAVGRRVAGQARAAPAHDRGRDAQRSRPAGPRRARVDRRDLPELRAAGARVIASVWGTTVEDFGRAALLMPAATTSSRSRSTSAAPTTTPRADLRPPTRRHGRRDRRGGRRRPRPPDPRQALPERDRSHIDRPRRRRSRSHITHTGEHAPRAPDRRRHPRGPSSAGVAVACPGPAIKPIALRGGARRHACPSPACPSSAPVV